MQLGHVDALVFTAGLGENDWHTRERILKRLEKGMKLDIDYDKNMQAVGKECRISRDDSSVQVWVIPTDEELMIARDTADLLKLD
jgi:acetate kinase